MKNHLLMQKKMKNKLMILKKFSFFKEIFSLDFDFPIGNCFLLL